MTTKDLNLGAHEEKMGLAHDRDQIREDFTNGGRGHSPKHLKFFLLVFSEIKEEFK